VISVIRRAAALLAAAALVTSACGGDGATSSPAPTPVATAAAATGGAQVTAGAGAPDALRFTAPLVGGGEVDLAGYAAQPVLLWFWAPY
jgi:hypothetical protein